MQNCDKSILVCYINIGSVNKQDALVIINQLDDVIKKRFNENKIVGDDSLVILTIPVQDQPTKIELLNARYPKCEELIEQTKEMIKNYFDENKNINI